MDNASIGARLRKLRKDKKMSAYVLADQVGTTAQQLYLLEAGKRTLTREWAERLAPHLGVSPVELIFPELARPPSVEVPVFGYAGAREIVDIPDKGVHHAIDAIELPSLADQYAAVIVRGDSMKPAYNPGDTLLFLPQGVRTYSLDELYGHDCVVMTERDRAYVKLVRKGREPGLVDLVSYNPAVEPLYDVRLEWGAPVLWVKRGK